MESSLKRFLGLSRAGRVSRYAKIALGKGKTLSPRREDLAASAAAAATR